MKYLLPITLSVAILSLTILSNCDLIQDVDPPSASFTFLVSSTVPGEVSFQDFSSDADDYDWSFGDGNGSFLESPTHTYTESGTYTVTLTVSNDGGSDVDVQTLSVVVTVDAEVTNNLYADVNIYYNGTFETTILARDSYTFQINPSSTHEVTWELVPPFSTGCSDFLGQATSSDMRGSFQESFLTGDWGIEIDNVVSDSFGNDETYMGILFTNNTSTAFSWFVNPESSANNWSSGTCQVLSFQSDVFVGYYIYLDGFSDEDVRNDVTSTVQGQYGAWNVVSSMVGFRSGATFLSHNSNVTLERSHPNKEITEFIDINGNTVQLPEFKPFDPSKYAVVSTKDVKIDKALAK